MHKIVPHLWFDTQAKEAVDFYTSIFPDSKILHTVTLHNTPSGDSDVVSFQLAGQRFMAISAGPYFKINPAISFFVHFETKEALNDMWGQLSEGGMAMMPLQKYPFSEWYGWVQDKYGVSWQLILADPNGEKRPMIVPSLLFVGGIYGKAEEATKYYVDIFKPSKIGTLQRYGVGQEPNKEDTLMFGDFMLGDQWFSAMDGGGEHAFGFNEAVSLLVECDDQKEIDYFWDKLSAVPESEQCGWLKDKFGVSWQISPKRLQDMMLQSTPEQFDRVTQAFLKMKKFDLAALEKAFNG